MGFQRKIHPIILKLLIFSFFSGLTSAQTNVSSCTTINTPGTYVLTQDIVNYSTYPCITISSSNVDFNGQGYMVDGRDNDYSVGVYVYNAGGTLTNVTVQNVLASDWNEAGIKFTNVQNSSMVNNSVSSSYRGLRLEDSFFNTLYSNVVTGATNVGIYPTSSGNNSIYNNYLNNSGSNYYRDGTTYSNYLNTTLASGSNILGGSFIGGNFWATPSGTGFSETCSDSNADGLCEAYYSYQDIDYNPLAGTTGQAMTACGYINRPGAYHLGADIRNSSTSPCITISSHDVDLNGQGYLVDGTLSDSSIGVYAYNSSSTLVNITVRNVLVSDWAEAGIKYRNTRNGSMINNTAFNNTRGLRLEDSFYNTLHSNTVKGSPNVGVYYTSSGNNTVYNNYLNNSGSNYYRDGTVYNNYLNTTRQNATNILGGSWISGNFWATPSGTGFSETCSDSNADGLCEAYYSFQDIDYNPLAGTTGQPMTACTPINQPGTYQLGADIINSSASECITISSSDVVFDGQGFMVDGPDDWYNTGVYVYKSGLTLSNVTVRNLVVSEWESGIYFNDVENSAMLNNTLPSSFQFGLRINDGFGNTLADNRVSASGNTGIYFTSSGNNTVYNNFLNNSGSNYYRDGTSFANFLNTSRQTGTSIIGKPTLGGNYWALPTGLGFSQTCTSADDDGICDQTYSFQDVDYHPLTLTATQQWTLESGWNLISTYINI
ncbi:MAG: NosD domain-containing protein [Candidatus Altiarchaeota archaeon]